MFGSINLFKIGMIFSSKAKLARVILPICAVDLGRNIVARINRLPDYDNTSIFHCQGVFTMVVYFETFARLYSWEIENNCINKTWVQMLWYISATAMLSLWQR